MTVKEAFATYLSRIELNTTKVKLASERYNALKNHIESSLPGKTIRQIGSFQRNTKIKPLDLSDNIDVDMLVSFGNAERLVTDGKGMSTEKALNIIRTALVSNKTYKVMDPVADAPAVVLDYSDNFKVELVPAFVDMTGQHSHENNNPLCYLVAKPNGWVPADYDYDASLITSYNQNQYCKEMLIPLVKMFKFFCRTHGIPLKGFYLELITCLAMPTKLKEWTEKKYTWGYNHMIAELLRQASRLVGQSLELPNSFTPKVDTDLTSVKVARIADWFYKKGDRAWELCNTGKTSATNVVIQEWSDFFGKPFPIE